MLGGGGVTVDMRDAQIYIEKTLKNGKTRLNQRWGRGGLSIPTGGVFTTPPQWQCKDIKYPWLP